MAPQEGWFGREALAGDVRSSNLEKKQADEIRPYTWTSETGPAKFEEQPLLSRQQTDLVAKPSLGPDGVPNTSKLPRSPGSTAARAEKVANGLLLAAFFNLLAFASSLAGFLISGSTALFADAMLVSVDCVGYFINWYAEASRNDDRPTKCGYFASFFGSVTFLLAGCYIIVDAVHELLTDDEDSIDPKTMLIFACMGVIIDLVQIVVVSCSQQRCGEERDLGAGDGMMGSPAQSTEATAQQDLNIDQSFYHILIDFSRGILTTSCAAIYYLGLSKKEDTELDECTAILTCSIGMLISAYVLVQVSWQYSKDEQPLQVVSSDDEKVAPSITPKE